MENQEVTLTLEAMQRVLSLLRNQRTEERPDPNRHVAVAITEAEKPFAYYVTYVAKAAADA